MGNSLHDVTFLKRDPEDRKKGIYRFKSCGHEQSIRSDQFETKWGAKCRTCEEHRFHSEAKQAGLRLLGVVQSGDAMGRRRYLCLTCDKALDITLRDVRRSNFRCQFCLEEKWDEEADAYGLRRLGLPENDAQTKKGYDFYRFVQCGHEQLLQRTHVREKSAKCTVCKTQLLKVEAEEKGLQYLGGDETRKGHGDYKFLSCRHVQEISFGRVRVDRFHCKKCINLRIKKEAASVGLELLGAAHSGDNKYRSYKQSCGHVRDFTKASVKKGTFQCEICENSALTRPSQIYLLRLKDKGFEWLKLGFSNNLKRRVETYGISKKCRVYLIASLEISTGREAQAREKSFHGSKPWKSRKLAKKKMREFLVESGWTECYSTEYQSEIIEVLGLEIEHKPVDLRTL